METLDQTFLIKLAMSFAVGSIWITSVTVIAERFGSKIGGFIGGLPSTIVVALLFIGITQSTAAASQAAVMIPMVMGINGFFIIIYLVAVQRGLIKAILAALAFWFVVIYGVVQLGLKDFPASMAIWLSALIICVLITEKVLNITHKGGVRVPYTMQQIVTRGIVSGLIISSAVLITKLSGPVVGGIFSNFPVIFTSTLYITYRTGGVEFSRAVAKTLMLSAMINVGVYSFTAHFAYQHTTLVWGTLIAIAVSFLSASVTYRLIRRLTR